MSPSWLNTYIDGSLIYQDKNPNWAKIDNVVLGDSSGFGYQTLGPNMDISTQLTYLQNDPNAVVLDYCWSNGYGYVKKGFNPGIAGDVSQKSGFTSFIKIAACSPTVFLPLNQVPPPPPPPPPAPPAVPFVTWNGSQFMCNGSPFVPVGFNAYWMAFTEQYGYPPHAQVDEMFYVAQQMQATVIRCLSLGWSSNYSNALINSDLTINNNAWPAIDYIFYKANQTGIKLIADLTQEFTYVPGDVTAFTNYYGLSAPDFFYNSTVIAAFQNYVATWLNHTNQYTGVQIKNDPALFAIELGNELGNLRSNVNANTIPPQSWLQSMVTFIKSIDANHLILDSSDECLGSGTSNDFAVSGFDIFQGHFYWEDYHRLNSGASGAAAKGKPYIIGEYSSQFGQDWFNTIEATPNVKGTIFWDMYPHQNGTAGGAEVPHNDGYTIYYDSNWSSQLLLLTNHMRRMRGLPQVSSVPGLIW
ncbi:hypothetical protein SmJEL517_g06125 [Synchytrium microbalum]|uniref:mannan endo-1,4-beta-mannosidase n=1 Tax=Synchytrium microbalum TaxID=1806994 RepID=A0A507BWU5_9FUNG|nr:uncharacterized protein SmJEL517_g06125 [Synchytrium microbalum]TPX30284.1 hypothetical protein SmJEL517_g06125 [Synchytrium microbalum]